MTSSAVLSPGLKISWRDFCFVHALGFGLGDDSALDGALDDFVAVEAAAVVGDFDHHLIALVKCVQANCSASGLAGRDAFVGGLDAVVSGVANEMHERFG